MIPHVRAPEGTCLEPGAILATLGTLLAAAHAALEATDPQVIHRRVLELDSHVDVLLPGASGRIPPS